MRHKSDLRAPLLALLQALFGAEPRISVYPRRTFIWGVELPPNQHSELVTQRLTTKTNTNETVFNCSDFEGLNIKVEIWVK